ncbi:hypothetical protein MesoLjLc_74410 [Mesorhizobium sp. L-8-10]|uniref:calcium-binding protein n=1 Tax=Mesorhizobium sp. L-8-10 TaxID=2744523 RepID=UPI001925304B|nr:calcium-binding protein [Mesorhizobium sp. L-8-10]BCH35511.1 hypothetical protein MesoLjLc_74410 [Mesorhizobium sp. L-8-10]
MASKFPDASNTGVPAGVTLTPSGSIVVTKAGTVLKNLDIKGDIYVMAPNVTIENCRITTSSWQGINTNGSAGGLVVQNCEINGQGKMAGSYGIMGHGTFIGNNIYGFENGIGLSGGSGGIVKGNFIHDLQAPGSDPHYDGIAIQGGQSNVLVEGNTVFARDTSNIFIKNDFGPISDVRVNNNYLAGDPGIMIYVDGRASGGPITGVSITNNYMEKGYYDYFSIDNSSPVISGNVYLKEGQSPYDVGGGSTGGTGDGSTTVKTIMGTAGHDIMPATGISNSGSEKYYGLAGNDTLRGGAGADHLDGGAGYDAASYAGSNAGVTVSLLTGKGTGGDAQDETLVSIENLMGSGLADRLYGNSGNNVLNGGAGADYLDGGNGIDTASYSGSNAGVTINLATGRGTGGHAQGDTLVNIENLNGSHFADKLYGNAGNNVLKGGASADFLSGGAGADYLDGGSGGDAASYADSNAGVTVSLLTGKGSGGHAQGDTLLNIWNLVGSRFADKLYGNASNNVLVGGAGADYLHGGDGSDMASYSGSNAGVTVDLRTGKGAGGHAQGDTLVSIGNLKGSSYHDRLIGNDNANLLDGAVGNDTLYGLGGNDVLKGGAGNDVLIGGAGKDTFVFNTALNAATNVDRITDFSVVDDVIHLENAVFKALAATGTLSSGYFVKNTTGLAQDANDHIIYETDTGKLFYDSNGSAAGGSVHFATLSPSLNLTAADFVVI